MDLHRTWNKIFSYQLDKSINSLLFYHTFVISYKYWILSFCYDNIELNLYFPGDTATGCYWTSSWSSWSCWSYLFYISHTPCKEIYFEVQCIAVLPVINSSIAFNGLSKKYQVPKESASICSLSFCHLNLLNKVICLVRRAPVTY